MPKIINVPGVGRVPVPDDYTFDQIFDLREQLQKRAGLEPDLAPQFGLGELASRGFERGVERLKIGFGDVIPAMVGSKLGFEDYAKRQMEEAVASEQALQERLPPMFKSYEDIKTAGDIPGYVAETFGEVGPDILTSLIPGSLGATVGRIGAQTAARQALAGAARQGLAKEAAVKAAEEAAERSATRGMLAGTYLGSYAQNTPEVFQSIYQETGKMEPAVAALYGGLSAALDSILPAKLLNQIGTVGKGALIREMVKESGADPKVWKTIGSGVTKGFLTEGVTETGQEFINNLAVKTLKENHDLFSPDNVTRYIDSFLRGAIVGGGVSLPTSAVEAVRERSVVQQQKAAEQAKVAEQERIESERLASQEALAQRQQILGSIPQGVQPIEIGDKIFTIEQTGAATDQVPRGYVVSGAQFSREVGTLEEAEKLKASIEGTKDQDIQLYEKKLQATTEKIAKLDEELERQQRDVINIPQEDFAKFQNETYPKERSKLVEQSAQEAQILENLQKPVTISPKTYEGAETTARGKPIVGPRGQDEFTAFEYGPEGKKPVAKAPTQQDAQVALDRLNAPAGETVETSVPTPEPTDTAEAFKPSELGGEEVQGPELDELRQELDRLGLPEVGLKLIRGLTGQGSPVDGAFGAQTIYVSMTPAGRTRKQTLHHEVIHALKEAGLFTDSEWKALSTAAKNDWMKRKWPNLGDKTIPETYGDLSIDEQIEEAIAVAFEHYTQKQFSPAGLVAKAFQKIANVFGRVKNFFTGKGYQTAEDVFDFVESGAMRYKVRPGEEGQAGVRYLKRGDFDETGGVKFAKAPPVDTKEFKQWFNKSVVEKNGKPLVVYHGTSAVDEFSAFDTAKYGAWFSEEDALANLYATSAAYRGPESQGAGRVIPAFLSIQTPFVIPDDVDLSKKISAREAFDRINDENGGTDFSPSDIDVSDDDYDKAYKFFANPKFIDLLRKNGYDGMSAKENKFATWNVFSPQQAKSAFNVGAFGQRPITAKEAKDAGLTLEQAQAAQKKGDIKFARSVRTTLFGRVVMVGDIRDYNAKQDNFNNQVNLREVLHSNIPQPLIRQADEYVEQFFAAKPEVTLDPEERLRAEDMLRPKMQLAQDAKNTYDQMILNIVNTTDAIGQMLAPIKGLKRAAEKLALEEKFQIDNMKDLLRSTIVVTDYSQLQDVVDAVNKNFNILRIKNRSENPVVGPNLSTEPRKKFGGYSDVLINIVMPNGIIAEIQINSPVMLAAKDEQGHKLYEAAREQPKDSELYQQIYQSMESFYDAAFFALNALRSEAQTKKARSLMGAAPLSGIGAGERVSPLSSSLKEEPSGRTTISSPEKVAMNLVPSGKESGTRIIVPPSSKTKYALSFPQDVTDKRSDLKLKRLRLTAAGKAYPGAPKNERTVLTAKGKPDFVIGDITFDDWKERVETVLSSEEIMSFSKWYEEIRDLFKQYFPPNDPDVDRYMAAWLVANQNTDVASAMKNALLQAEQIGRKIPEAEMKLGGLETASIAARNAIRGLPITEGVGVKISDFVDSAIGKKTRTFYGDKPVGAEPFVVDIHSARDTGLVDPILLNHLRRLGYEVPESVQVDFPMGPAETQYENRADFGRKLTKHLNSIKWMGKSDWKPAEVQAVGWMTMTRLTADAAENTRTALERNLQRISMEAAPGDGSPFAEKYGEAFSQLPGDQQANLTQAMTNVAIEAAQEVSGIKLSSIVHGMGGWQHFQNPATVAQTLATPKGAEIASNVIGYLLQQTEVWSNAVKPMTKNPKGFAIDFIEKGTQTLSTDEGLRNFWSTIMEVDPTKLFVGYQPIRTVEGDVGIRVLVKKGGEKTAEKIKEAITARKTKPEDPQTIISAIESSGLKMEVLGHEAEIITARNDWTQEREGRAYLERLVDLGIADPAARLDRVRGELEGILKEGTRVRFARSPESAAGPSGSGSVVLGRTRKEDASEVRGVHYGNKLVDTLLGSMYGTGIRGAERQRLAQSNDPRIKKRVYFYIEKPDGKMPRPESGLGVFVYTQNFGNILSAGEKMSDMYAKSNRDFNTFESAVVNAGYDGYAVPSMGMMVILNHDVPVNYEGTRDKVKFAREAKDGLPPNVLKAEAMARLNETQPPSEPNGFNLARSPMTAKAGMNVMNQFVQQAPSFGKDVVQRILDMPKNNRAMVYKFLTLEQLADVGKEILPELQQYYDTFQDMAGYREKQIYYAQKIAEKLSTLRNKSPEMVDRLADVCHDATLLSFDPDRPGAGMSLAIMKLKGDWNKLSPEAKALYVEMRDFYEKRFNAYRAMLEDRVNRTVTDPTARQNINEKFRQMFETAKTKGPYFPLSRFGQYWVSFEESGIKNFRMFETLADSQRFQKELDAKGIPHNQGVRGDTMIPDGIPSSAIKDIIGLVDTAGNPGELKQQIWNTYLSMLPEVSMRKHFLPRKGTPGYSNDIVRAFSENTFHGAYALSRLKFAPDFEGAIDAMKKREKDLSGEKDAEKRSELLREVESRQTYIDNPTDTNFFTNMAGTIGFTWFLTAPASAITNLAQNVTVAFPILSAKFGTGAAMKEMSVAYKQFISSAKRGEETIFDIQRSLEQLYQDTKSPAHKRELKAITALLDNGTLSRTQTMDLAQLADKPSMTGTRFHSTMKFIGALFHGAEVMNRTTTALAAFRLSYDKHKSLGESEAFDRAVKDARDIVRKAHFDYTASNKPPIMQGKAARVLFMFKQYGQHMAYMMLRETQLYGKYLINKYRGTPMQKEAIERAKEARDTMIGILCTTGMFSGVFGLPYPLYVMTITIANAMFGDEEDEVFDAETRFKLWLTDTLGAGPADIIAKGPISYLTGADVSDRISLNGLIFRDFGRLGPRQAKDQDQIAATQQFLVEITGPMGSLAMNIGQGIESFNNGQVYRGIERMVPAPLRDLMETYRYNTEGVLTLKGDPILDEVSSLQSFINLIGFSPVDLARQYEENAAIKAVESQANMERKRILNKFALATHNFDYDAMEDVEEAIERFNEKFPTYAITGSTLARSLKAREAAAAENEHGIRVTKKLQGIAERGGQLTGTE